MDGNKLPGYASYSPVTEPPCDILSRLPPEVFSNIVNQIRPTGSLTTYRSSGSKPEVLKGCVESRATFRNLSLTSKRIGLYGYEYLYKTVILQNSLELVYFLRTILNNPSLCPSVQSLAWLGILSTGEKNVETTAHEEERMRLSTTILNNINWSLVDEEMVRSLSIDCTQNPDTWTVLRATLALIPDVKSLFLSMAGLTSPMPTAFSGCQEISAMWRSFSTQEAPPVLRNLESVTMEPRASRLFMRPEIQVQEILIWLLTSSPIRRIETKIWTPYATIRDLARGRIPGELVSETVEEILLLRTSYAQVNLEEIEQLFPNLKSLQVEYQNGFTRFEPIPNLKMSHVLSKLSGTLEVLSLTTQAKSSWIETKIIPPMLPALKDLTRLRRLKMESVWLFGTENVFRQLIQLDSLPTTLVSFELIDYWATADRDTYYSALGDDWDLLGFYDSVLATLYRNCISRLHDIRTVILTSDSLCNYKRTEVTVTTNDDNADQTIPKGAQSLLLKYREKFNSSGIQLSLRPPCISQAELESSWANFG